MTVGPRVSDKPHAFSAVIGEAIEMLTNPLCSHLTTGLLDLDSILDGGLPIGTISAVAARSMMGREQLARHVALSVARKGDGVLYFSPEHPKSSIAWQGLTEVLNVDLGSLRKRSNRQKMRDLIAKYEPELSALANLPIAIDDTPSLNTNELHDRLVGWCRSQTSASTPARLVIIDSLSHLFPALTPPFDPVKPFMEMLSDLARRESIHILCTVPVSPHVDVRESRVPRLFDLWGCGVVERFCDTVIAIYRDNYYYPSIELEASEAAHVVILRSAATAISGRVCVSFLRGRFSDFHI